MSSSELADQSRRVQGDWLRALGILIVLPLVVVAAVLLGGVSPSLGAATDHRPLTLSVPTTSTPATPTTTAPPVTTTTTATPPPVATAATAPPPATAPAAAPSVSPPSGYGCAAALAYLAANAAPGFSFECPGYADGHEAMTCVNTDPECVGEHLIVIADPCPAAYMNEAYNSNSWSDATDSFTRPIDPYGAC
jgi:hypothetical protein